MVEVLRNDAGIAQEGEIFPDRFREAEFVGGNYVARQINRGLDRTLQVQDEPELCKALHMSSNIE